MKGKITSQKMKVGILTTFYTWSKSYSLTSVVEEQLYSLIEGGIEAVLFVHDNFDADDKVPKGVEIRKIVPRFNLIDYNSNQPISADFELQAESVKQALIKNIQDIDVVFTHDLIFQGWFLPYNAGMRKCVNELKCRWYHWIHSAPSLKPANLEYPHTFRYTMMPNSKLIYMNNYDIMRLAEMYGGTIDDVRMVHNPLDLRSIKDYHPFVEELIKKYNLYEADIIDVYPVSSTRFDGKQVDKVIKIMSELKKKGKSVRFICANAHANAEKEKKLIQELKDWAKTLDLTDEEVIFTSTEGTEYEHGVPREVVTQLFSLSNLFIFPTRSENCPLVLLEAAANKCLLVLNEDFPPLRDFFQEDALYFKFSSEINNTTYSDENKYFEDIALIILGELAKNKPLGAFRKLKSRFNRKYIFENQLLPIINEKW